MRAFLAKVQKFLVTKTWPNEKMPVWAWCAVALAALALVIVIAVAASVPASTTGSQTPAPPTPAPPTPTPPISAAASQAARFQITAVNTTSGAADADFAVMVDSYTPTTDVAALRQEGETIIAAWKQDKPMPSVAPFYITYSSIDGTAMFVKRVIRTLSGTVYLMFSNSTATSKTNVPIDNTGTWTYLYDGKGTARAITFAEAGSTGLLRTKHRYVQQHRHRG